MGKNGLDNYEKQVYIARELFLKYDQQKILRRVPLKYDEEFLYIRMLGENLRISRMTGEVWCPVQNTANTKAEDCVTEYEVCTDFSVVMTVYDVLCYSEEIPVVSGMWCSLNSLQLTAGSPDSDPFTRTYASAFSGRVQELKAACRQIGGIEPAAAAHADVCWQFDVFPFFPVQFRFWDGDDEFEPRIQLLWDRNSLKFMHYETLYYVVGILMKRLTMVIKDEKGGKA